MAPEPGGGILDKDDKKKLEIIRLNLEGVNEEDDDPDLSLERQNREVTALDKLKQQEEQEEQKKLRSNTVMEVLNVPREDGLNMLWPHPEDFSEDSNYTPRYTNQSW